MKQIVRSLVVVGALSGISTADAQIVVGDFCPYIGVDYIQTWMTGFANWSEILPKSFPGGTIYLGTKFHENFGVEAGFTQTFDITRNETLSANQSFFFAPVLVSTPESAKVSRNEWFIDLVGFLPVFECFDLIGSIGAGWTQSKVSIEATLPPGGNARLFSALSSISGGDGRGVFRAGVGGQYMVTDMVGLRVKVGWENTGQLRLNNNGNANFGELGFSKKPFKDATTLSGGIFVRF